MAIPKRYRRSLQDIRILSGTLEATSAPYMAYMKVSCLEMERARRETEKASAMARVNSIDARIKEIEAEKDVLLRSLSERNADSDDPSRAASVKDRQSGAGVLKFKY